MSELALRSVSKSFGTVEVIKGIDLEIKHGEFVVFVGPSGCGKSTLLRMIAGLEEITEGDLVIGGVVCNEIEPRDRGVAMVFQNYALYPHMSVYDNVGFALKMSKTPKAERDKKIREAARILQMEHLLERKPRQLSGGQRQRVAIGRAIVRQPDVFLFDEPLSNLDASLRVSMRQELSRLHNELGATMIYVTHDQVEAMTMADKIMILDAGKVQQYGSPIELYANPTNIFVAGFIGSPAMNFLDVTVKSAQGEGVVVQADGIDDVAVSLPAGSGDVQTGQALKLGVRPHALERDETGPITGVVELVERLGHETIVNFKLSSGESWMAALDGNVTLELDQPVAFQVGQDSCLLFDRGGNNVRASARMSV
ncbi:MAG: sn-glycerol-3-phosphate ABC transporter ATP-binding protein UgpC [Roseitalea sp.]|jgi:multiple sugar transport system ATP-binding protein|nr:sn-glycerol-3-phosphate ABC transporter ATP-binding protein UgpC [Roseitalea sp.]MBO6720776.1 sn-glycerol-3-phosphate ABC transporter ATP-binding protein UgpC [Roseitalea sp.]MBO6743923.1 sn-glycerol-3-phosphate ABC transporter ATP-binding protein UgpC [Roseitalea sp.]